MWNLRREKGWNRERETKREREGVRERGAWWQTNVTRGHSLSRRDILPRRRAKGEKQWPWKDDMPAQRHYCRNNKGCCWATRIRGHGNRGAFSVPESIMLLFPHSDASLHRCRPLMYLSQADTIRSLASALSLSHFPLPSTALLPPVGYISMSFLKYQSQ